jgi:hypothetical protein
MTKEEIIKHVREGTDWTLSVKTFREDLRNANELLLEGALEHQTYGSDALFPTNLPNLDFVRSKFFLVDGFDYTQYEV